MDKAESCCESSWATRPARQAARITAEGVVSAFIDGGTGALLEINCETDFVTKNDSFPALALAAAELIARNNPADVGGAGSAALQPGRLRPRRSKTSAGAWSARSART